MKIRRYYGHDCDSETGFSNGQYLDDKPIEAKDETEAMQLCLKALFERWDPKDNDPDLRELDNGWEFITGYFDVNGGDISRDEFEDLSDKDMSTSYRYVYVTFEEGEL